MVLSISFESKLYIESGNLIYKSEFLRAYNKDKRAEKKSQLTQFFLSSMHYSCYEVIINTKMYMYEVKNFSFKSRVNSILTLELAQV